MIIFDFKRDTFLRETIVYSPAPSTNLNHYHIDSDFSFLLKPL